MNNVIPDIQHFAAPLWIARYILSKDALRACISRFSIGVVRRAILASIHAVAPTLIDTKFSTTFFNMHGGVSTFC